MLVKTNPPSVKAGYGPVIAYDRSPTRVHVRRTLLPSFVIANHNYVSVVNQCTLILLPITQCGSTGASMPTALAECQGNAAFKLRMRQLSQNDLFEELLDLLLYNKR